MMNIVNFMIMAMVMVLLMMKIIIIMKKCSKSRRCVRGVGGGQIIPATGVSNGMAGGADLIY